MTSVASTIVVCAALALVAGAVFLLLRERAERRRVEHALLAASEDTLRRSEDFFRVLVEKSSDATSLIDPQAVILYTSPSSVRVLGYTSEELVGRSGFDMIHPDDLALVHASLEEMLAHPDRDVTLECRAQHKDGSWRWVVCTGYNRLNEPGVQAIVVNYRDSTTRKEAEKEILASRERLQVLSRQLIVAQETERRRLARELHDEIGQVLTLVNINLQTLKTQSGPEVAARLDESLLIVGQALQQVRDLSLALRPSMLDDFGLVATLKWYVEAQRQRAGLEITLDAETCGGRLPGELEVTCFRVVQEALTNVVRHARARQLWIDLRQREDDLELTIRDDGTGFDLAEARKRAGHGLSAGLLGMEERVELLGGTIEIDTAPGRGTIIRVRLSAQPHPSVGGQGEENKA